MFSWNQWKAAEISPAGKRSVVRLTGTQLKGNSSKPQMQLRLDLRKVLLQKLWMVETRRALWSYPHCGWNQSQLWINPNFCWNRDFYPGNPWPGKKCLGVQGTMSRHLRPCHARDVSRLQLDPLVVLLSQETAGFGDMLLCTSSNVVRISMYILIVLGLTLFNPYWNHHFHWWISLKPSHPCGFWLRAEAKRWDLLWFLRGGTW